MTYEDEQRVRKIVSEGRPGCVMGALAYFGSMALIAAATWFLMSLIANTTEIREELKMKPYDWNKSPGPLMGKHAATPQTPPTPE